MKLATTTTTTAKIVREIDKKKYINLTFADRIN